MASPAQPAHPDEQPAYSTQVLRVPSAVLPGDPLRTYLESAVPLAEVTLTVELPDGDRVAGRGFVVDNGPGAT